MQAVTHEPHLLGRTKLAQEHRVLDRHQPIDGSIDEQQPTTLHVNNTSLYQGPGVLGIVHKVIVGLVAKLFCQGGQSVPRVFLVLCLFEPLAGKEVVGSCALANGACESVGVGVCCADLCGGQYSVLGGRRFQCTYRVVSSGTQAPCDDTLRVVDALSCHPVQDACP